MRAGRLTRPAEFNQVLAARSFRRSAHFAVYHLPSSKLSTRPMPPGPLPVDEAGLRCGLVVPKRHASRAVTRSLIKRMMRAALARWGARMKPGCWVLRLAAPLDAGRYRSAVSAALRAMLRSELDALLAAAVRERPGGR